MPSFLNDESTIFSNNADILNLDPNNQFGLATTKERVNGGSIHQPHHTRSDTINESFDNSSISSSHASDVSDANPTPMNGNGTRPTSMSSLPNGKTLSGGYQQKEYDDGFREQSLPNGTTNLVDRSLPKQPPKDVNRVEPTMSFDNAQNHDDFFFSKPLPAEPQSPDDARERVSRQSQDAAPRISTASSNTPTAFLTPGPPTPDNVPTSHRSQGGHRYSSPPLYQPGHAAASSSSHLQAPPVPPPLKQRHTLDVPKYPPGRGSKDGLDTAQASGRFSPTNAPVTTERARRASLSLARRNTRSMQSDIPRDEVVPDEDAIRWAEAYRQKRATKRKRKEEQDDDRVLVGTKVDESHANWVTAYNMLTGIRVSVSRTNAKLDRELTDADFETKQKSTFDM